MFELLMCYERKLVWEKATPETNVMQKKMYDSVGVVGPQKHFAFVCTVVRESFFLTNILWLSTDSKPKTAHKSSIILDHEH